MVEIGFTGTLRGMTDSQKETVTRIVKELPHIRKSHHGDCEGSDSEFHDICKELGIRIAVHPPDDPKHRAFRVGHEMFEPKPYLERNQDIVKSSKIMLATPGEYIEQKRSGTWYTVRRAREHGREIFIVFPNGMVEREKGVEDYWV